MASRPSRGYVWRAWGWLGTTWGPSWDILRPLGAIFGMLGGYLGPRSPCWNTQIAFARPLCSENACMQHASAYIKHMGCGSCSFYTCFIGFFVFSLLDSMCIMLQFLQNAMQNATPLILHIYRVKIYFPICHNPPIFTRRRICTYVQFTIIITFVTHEHTQ